LLADAGKVLTQHADELDVFEKSLDRLTRIANGLSPALSQHLKQMRHANRDVEKAIQGTIEELIATCGDLFTKEQSHLAAYQEKTEAFDGTLEDLDRDALLAAIASKLLNMVHDLRDENRVIRDEVRAAQDRTIELMARAYAAEQIARLDTLTQLPNRRAFDEAHAECHNALKHSGQPYCLVLIDVDHFKSVNDAFGHAAGDAVLSMIGRVLRESRRTSDHVCRLGGEEFGLLLPRCEEESARSVGERYRRKIASATLRYRNHELSVTASCGIAQAILGETRSRLLERADAALYAAKMRGRDQICVYQDVALEDRSTPEEAATE
jgi:diguanylate cyclase